MAPPHGYPNRAWKKSRGQCGPNSTVLSQEMIAMVARQGPAESGILILDRLPRLLALRHLVDLPRLESPTVPILSQVISRSQQCRPSLGMLLVPNMSHIRHHIDLGDGAHSSRRDHLHMAPVVAHTRRDALLKSLQLLMKVANISRYF